MAYPLELDITFSSAKDLKNVNWRNGDLKPYVVASIDLSSKLTTKADEEGDTSPAWNEHLIIPLRGAPLDDALLHIDVVHAGSSSDTKPLVGSAKIPLKDIVDEVGFSKPYETTLKLKRPSGRPQGKLSVRATIREMRYPGRKFDPGASSSHGQNMSINGSEQPLRETEEHHDQYFDKGSALAGVCCCVQLGGLSRAAVSKPLPAACYIAVAAVAFILSLFVLVRCQDLPRGVRKFCLFVAFFFLFLDYWIIKPLLP